MKYLKYLIPLAIFFVAACASTFDASNLHHSFGIGTTTHVNDSSIVINSNSK